MQKLCKNNLRYPSFCCSHDNSKITSQWFLPQQWHQFIQCGAVFQLDVYIEFSLSTSCQAKHMTAGILLWGNHTAAGFNISLSLTVPTPCLILEEGLHPSIFYNVNPSVGSRGGWSLSQRSSGERRGTGRQSITGPHRDKRDKQPHTLTLTPKDNLE